MNNRARGWCFTINNPTDQDDQDINILTSAGRTIYTIIGREVGESGTPHYQGYTYVQHAITMQTLSRTLRRAHLQIARGTPEQNRVYCSKDRDFTEWGTCPRQGRRTDLEEVSKDIISKGLRIDEVISEFPHMVVKYPRGMTMLCDFVTLHRNENIAPSVLWLWGPTGVGKTRYGVDKYGVDNIYIKDGTQWWDGYKQQDCVIIDDFDGKWPYRDLLRLLDRYPYQGQIKGGYVKINSPCIIITCEHPPDFMYHGTQLEQIKRRISEIREMKSTEVAGNSDPATSSEDITPVSIDDVITG